MRNTVRAYNIRHPDAPVTIDIISGLYPKTPLTVDGVTASPRVAAPTRLPIRQDISYPKRAPTIFPTYTLSYESAKSLPKARIVDEPEPEVDEPAPKLTAIGKSWLGKVNKFASAKFTKVHEIGDYIFYQVTNNGEYGLDVIIGYLLSQLELFVNDKFTEDYSNMLSAYTDEDEALTALFAYIKRHLGVDFKYIKPRGKVPRLTYAECITNEVFCIYDDSSNERFLVIVYKDA